MHYNAGLHDGQHIAHMQGVTPASTHSAQSPPHCLDTVDRRSDDATPGLELEPSGRHGYGQGDIEMGLCDSATNVKELHAGDNTQAITAGLVVPMSDTRAPDVKTWTEGDNVRMPPPDRGGLLPVAFGLLPNELLFHILSFLDVCDLLSTSRVNRLLRRLSLAPLLHRYRLQRNRLLLPPLLASPCRPSLAELIARSIFMTKTSVVSRRLARSLVSIRLSRRLAARPPVEALVERAVLPKECVPGLCSVHVAPALLAKRKAIEKERTKDTLRRWVAAKWRGEVRVREEGVRRLEESRGIGRVWRLRRFWERVSRGDIVI